jgi:hypothetical protein
MDIRKMAFVLILSLVFVYGAQALTPDGVLISTDKSWVTAGGTDTSIITVTVINNSYPLFPVNGTDLTFWCDDPAMGIISPAGTQRINASQSITFVFRTGTKSGNATIHVSAANEGKTVFNQVTQLVDHATPKYFSGLIFPNSATVATDASISVQLTDKYGNPIDNKREKFESGDRKSVV